MLAPCFWQAVILLKDLVEGNKKTNKLRKVFLVGRDGELKTMNQWQKAIHGQQSYSRRRERILYWISPNQDHFGGMIIREEQICVLQLPSSEAHRASYSSLPIYLHLAVCSCCSKRWGSLPRSPHPRSPPSFTSVCATWLGWQHLFLMSSTI